MLVENVEALLVLSDPSALVLDGERVVRNVVEVQFRGFEHGDKVRSRRLSGRALDAWQLGRNSSL